MRRLLHTRLLALLSETITQITKCNAAAQSIRSHLKKKLYASNSVNSYHVLSVLF